jgi:hypothetical protein
MGGLRGPALLDRSVYDDKTECIKKPAVGTTAGFIASSNFRF